MGPGARARARGPGPSRAQARGCFHFPELVAGPRGGIGSKEARQNGSEAENPKTALKIGALGLGPGPGARGPDATLKQRKCGTEHDRALVRFRFPSQEQVHGGCEPDPRKLTNQGSK